MNKQKRIELYEEAYRGLLEVIQPSPLFKSYYFSEEHNNNIFIKAENMQRTGAFKIRGAYNKISHLSEKDKEKGLIASSAGNHAQGVALAAKLCHAKATIVMPSNTPLIKVEATKSYGAKVILHGDCYDDAYAEARRLEEVEGYTFIHPFDDDEIIVGQGTISIELLEQMEDIDIILVPIGGGGLISGVSEAAKLIKPDIKIIGIEPVGAQTLKTSIDKGQVTELDKVQTIAEGVAVKTAGNLTFERVRTYVDEIITVTDIDIMESFLLLAEKEKVVSENAGVLSIAALKYLDIKNKNIICLISGGNIDMVTISELISRGLVVRGRVFCFYVELSDTPGQLQKIATILSEHNANIIKLDHNQFKTVDRFQQVHLEVTCETNGKKHVEEIENALREFGYEPHVIY